MKPYKVFLRLEAMESLKGIRDAQRSRIARFIGSLTSDPSQSGDYAEQDDTQRQIEIKVIGQYAVTYWADHAVRSQSHRHPTRGPTVIKKPPQLGSHRSE